MKYLKALMTRFLAPRSSDSNPKASKLLTQIPFHSVYEHQVEFDWKLAAQKNTTDAINGLGLIKKENH